MFSEGRLRLAVTPEGLVEQLRSVHLPVLRERVAFISLNAWVERRANRAHFETCLQYGREFLNRETRDSATMRSFGKRWVVHTVHNSHTMPRDQNWNTTLERLQSVIAGTTVTVAAAGPSLEAFLASPAPFPVIAVDTALPALRRRGIIPEAVVVLDPQPWSLLHLRRGVPERTVLFLDAGVAPGAALRASRSGVVWFFGNHPLHQLLFSRGAPLLMLPSPPESVTEAAVLISRGLGAAEINLVGADGGYPRAVTYAPGTYQYALADRNASRLTPRAHFFSRSAYSGTTPTTNDTDTKPFFSNPALADRQIRIRAVADWKSPMAKPDTPWPVPRTDDNGINRFDPEQFWASHAHQLQTIMDALDEIEPASGIPVPKLMDILGPHGIAHLPAIAPDRGSWSSVDILAHIRTRIESLRGFILVENDRYSYTG